MRVVTGMREVAAVGQRTSSGSLKVARLLPHQREISASDRLPLQRARADRAAEGMPIADRRLLHLSH